MNPFDLRGPEFLGFYLAVGLALCVLIAFLRRTFESGPVPNLGEPDPYLLAHLRGGPNEAMRVATLSLFDRGLLKASGDILEAEPEAVRRARRPLERSILQAFATPAPAVSIFKSSEPRLACEALAAALERHRLRPSPGQIGARVLLALAAVALLWWIAATKIDVALQRGRSNVEFLFLLALAAPVVVVWLLRSRQTVLGQRLIEDHQTLFSRLRERAASIQVGGATNELALLAGIFGLGALAGPAGAQAQQLFPRGSRSTSDSASSACGSSCGSSCGGGGGGCGGGCGGCGG